MTACFFRSQRRTVIDCPYSNAARIFLCSILLVAGCTVKTSSVETKKWALVIHGGAGVIERASMTKETETAYRTALSAALEAGAKALREGGSALNAVESAVRLMDDDPLFHTGRRA